MDGILFGEKHTWKDWGMYLRSYHIAMPEPKRSEKDLLGYNGRLDMSEYPAGITYDNRTIIAELQFEDGSYAGMISKATIIAESIQGRLLHVVFDDDRGFYYIGRCTVDVIKINEMVSGITIMVDADPFKYETNAGKDWLWDAFSFKTGIIRKYENLNVSGSLTVRIPGRRKNIVPVIETNAPMRLEYEGTSYQIEPGRNKIYEIVIGEGEHSMTFYGKGIITVEYRGGII